MQEKSRDSKEIMTISDNPNISKSNYLISAKYQSTLLENQILALSLRKVKKEGNQWTSTLTAEEIKKVLGKDYQAFYSQLKETAVRLLHNVIMIEDPEKKKFRGSNIITDCESEDGNFKITYNPSMHHIISDLKTNFTVLNLNVMVQFESVLSFRLYELLKSKCYRPKGVENSSNVYITEFGLSELKITLGAININHQYIANMLNGKESPDYDKIMEEAYELSKRDSTFKKPKFEKWYDFKRQCLDPSIEELNTVSDLHVSYELIRSGKGGKVKGIRFIMEPNRSQVEVMEPKPEMKQEITPDILLKCIKDVSEIMEEPVPISDIESILIAADYDVDKVRNAYEVLKAQTEVQNVTGFMIDAIRKGYQMPIKRTSVKKNKFKNFKEHDTDFDALAEELMQAQEENRKRNY